MFAPRRISVPVAFLLLLTGCAAVPSTAQVETDPQSLALPVEAQRDPVATDFVEVQLVEFDVDDNGSLFIDGYLVAEYEVTNISGQSIQAIATTLTVETTAGEVLYSKNLNLELELAPGAETAFGLYGELRAPLLRIVPQWAALLDLADPATDSVMKLEIRKLMLENDGILVFRQDVPEGISIENKE
jgi:hypothetical protein